MPLGGDLLPIDFVMQQKTALSSGGCSYLFQNILLQTVFQGFHYQKALESELAERSFASSRLTSLTRDTAPVLCHYQPLRSPKPANLTDLQIRQRMTVAPAEDPGATLDDDYRCSIRDVQKIQRHQPKGSSRTLIQMTFWDWKRARMRAMAAWVG